MMMEVNQLAQKNNRKVLGSVYDSDISRIETRLKNFFVEGNTWPIRHWWNKYCNFIRTYSQWNFLCHIVGLGDRHTNNILVAEDGKIIHIDFEYIFDGGKMLPYPEWVPFRITRGLLQELGIVEPYGLMFS